MQGFFGWKHTSMCQEYISTSWPAIMHMAQTLDSFEFGDPEVELEVHVGDQVEPAQEDAVGVELDLCDFVMDEDPELYETAGIPLPGSSTGHHSVNIQKIIQSAISFVPGLEGSNVTVKVFVMGTIHGTVNF